MGAMNKSDVVSAIADDTDETQAAVERVLKSFFEVVGESISRGDKVVIPGWITFDRGFRAARQGINPRTKEPISIAATHTAKLKAGSKLKDKAKGN